MHDLHLYDDYSRKDIHDIFDPESTFTPQAGTWGLQGIVPVPERPGDYVFFVTFGQKQAIHKFDEGITADGILRWQSQPKQQLRDAAIQALIAHDEDKNSIYLFLRTAKKRHEALAPYTYLGRLKYLAHDRDRERPVYFTWQILDWTLPEDVRERIELDYEAAVASGPAETSKIGAHGGLVLVAIPEGSESRTGLTTANYAKRPKRDYAAQDARNRQLGLAGEETVVECERRALIAAGRADLAERVFHVAKIEGDGAGYDIKSFTPDGTEKFIEVKTTRGGALTAFYMSVAELRFAVGHTDRYYLYRVFEFDQSTASGKLFIHQGELATEFSLRCVEFKAVPANRRGE